MAKGDSENLGWFTLGWGGKCGLELQNRNWRVCIVLSCSEVPKVRSLWYTPLLRASKGLRR